jgi:hypothetical protein
VVLPVSEYESAAPEVPVAFVLDDDDDPPEAAAAPGADPIRALVSMYPPDAALPAALDVLPDVPAVAP